METEELRLALPSDPTQIRLQDEIALTRDCLWDRLRNDRSTSAVVCYHETMAFGAYAAVTELGWCIPRDLSVVGFDDVGALLAYPPMTVVSHMLREAGYTVLRFWKSEAARDLPSVIAAIRQVLEDRPPTRGR